ncbi:MAG: hypothetical protein JWP89_1400 [Schlesneria sp.]|nr:hypothetical protein [Schlesneria sp.]
MKTKLRGIFLTSEHPEQTAAFYRDVAGLDLEQVGDPSTYIYWKLDQDGLQLAIHDAQKFADYAYPAQATSNVTHLYFQIERHERFLEHLQQLHIQPHAIDDIVITVVDPDGRMVMFGTA